MNEITVVIRTRMLDVIRDQVRPGVEAHRVNMEVLRLADAMRVQLAGVRCSVHPEQLPIIVLRALPDGTVEHDRTAVCCQEFAERLM